MKLIIIFVVLISILVSSNIFSNDYKEIIVKDDRTVIIADNKSLDKLRGDFRLCKVINAIKVSSNQNSELEEHDCLNLEKSFLSEIISTYCNGYTEKDGRLVINPIWICDNYSVTDIVDEITSEGFLKLAAIVNRFDLTPSDLSDCGEFRLIFSTTSQILEVWNNFAIIFEPKLVNPRLKGESNLKKIYGCIPIYSFWKNLGVENETITDSSATTLKSLYFEKSTKIDSVTYSKLLSEENLSNNGQIRTSAYSLNDNHTSWAYNEFAFIYSKPIPVKVKNTVENRFYSDNFVSRTSDTKCQNSEHQLLQDLFVEKLLRSKISYLHQLFGFELSGSSDYSGDFKNFVESINNVNIDIDKCFSEFHDILLLNDANDLKIRNPNIASDIATWIKNEKKLPNYNLSHASVRLESQSCIGCHVTRNYAENKIAPNIKWINQGLPGVFVTSTPPTRFETSAVTKPFRRIFLPYRKKILFSCINDPKLCVKNFKENISNSQNFIGTSIGLQNQLDNIKAKLIKLLRKGNDHTPDDVYDFRNLLDEYNTLDEGKSGFFYITRPLH